MPGYIIHLCLAKEYMRKHKKQMETSFFDGTVSPDQTNDKYKTHFLDKSTVGANLYNFLLEQKLDTVYNEGYFLHLVADCLFYNKYFSGWRKMDSKLLYNDYDILNKSLIEKYNITYIPDGIEEYFNISKRGETIEYHYDKIIQFIEEVSEYDLTELAGEILAKKDYKFLFL